MGITLLPARCLHYLQRIGSGHEDLRHHGIRVKRDGGHELFDLLGGK